MRYRMLFGLSGCLPPLVVGLAACVGVPDGQAGLDLGHSGTGIAVTIAPLELPGVSDACYSFELLNGREERVVARGQPTSGSVAGLGGGGGPAGLTGAPASPLCSGRFGDGRGGIAYVAPCDASDPAHTLTLWVSSVCAEGSGWTEASCTALEGYVNPCGVNGCAVAATCVENADVPVSFNFTVMAPAGQGFFDLAVSFDSVFCSAKLDTCHGQDLIRLLHDGSGDRVHTAVAAVACTAGAGQGLQTHLHLTDLTVTCDGVEHALELGSVAAEGNVWIGDLRGGIYFGTEALPSGSGGPANKVYVDVALALPPGQSCALAWTVVPAATDQAPQPSAGADGEFAQVAGVRFDVADLAHGVCASHPLNGPGSGVTTAYLDETIDYAGSLGLDMTAFVPMHPVDPHLPPGFSRIEAALYQRGSPPLELGRFNDETQHWVQVTRPFYLQTTSVTQGQWAAAMQSWNALPDAQRTMSGWSGPTPAFGTTPSQYVACGADCPVDHVSWWDAIVYANVRSRLEGLPECYTLTGCTSGSALANPGGGCGGTLTQCTSGLFSCTGLEFAGLTCLGYRLPTEAEWELGARGGTATATYAGDLNGTSGCVTLTGAGTFPENTPLADIAWFSCNSSVNGPPEPAGQLAPNAFGLYDMLGNSWDWVWDRVGPYPAGTEGSPAVDPLGPDAGGNRRARGGRRGSVPGQVRAANRDYNVADGRFWVIGFRLARTATD